MPSSTRTWSSCSASETSDRAAALERVMDVESFAMGMDTPRKRHPGARRDPDLGNRLDTRARRYDYHAARVVY